jgi:hypothetical protein
VPLIKKTASKVILKYYRYNEDILVAKIKNGELCHSVAIDIMSNSLHTYPKVFDELESTLNASQITKIAAAHKDLAQLIFGEGAPYASLVNKLDAQEIDQIVGAHKDLKRCVLSFNDAKLIELFGQENLTKMQVVQHCLVVGIIHIIDNFSDYIKMYNLPNFDIESFNPDNYSFIEGKLAYEEKEINSYEDLFVMYQAASLVPEIHHLGES